jgi:hypothetical protein
MGYKKVIKITFDDLTEDPASDPVWVLMRNPRIMPQKEIESFREPGAYDDDGKVLDKDKAEASANNTIARLVIAARVYDPAVEDTYDPQTGEPVGDTAQALLPLPPWTPEVAAALPTTIRIKIMQEFAEALRPPKRA